MSNVLVPFDGLLVSARFYVNPEHVLALVPVEAEERGPGVAIETVRRHNGMQFAVKGTLDEVAKKLGFQVADLGFQVPE